MDAQTRQLERRYKESLAISDLALWLHQLVRHGQLNWWDAVDAIRIHHYGNTVPPLLRNVPNKACVRIFRVSGSLETRPDGAYSANSQISRIITMQTDIGLAEIIPKAYFLWGRLIHDLLENSTRTLSISPVWPLFQTFALQNYLPIVIISIDDSTIMNHPISAKHLDELFVYFNAFRMDRLIQTTHDEVLPNFPPENEDGYFIA